jgi:hypothetical protein
MGVIKGSHTVEIEASLEAVYEVAADVAGAPPWQPSVLAVEILETHADGTAALVELEADAVVKKSKAILAYEYSPPDGLSWVQEKGDPKSLEGNWKLEAIGENLTRATYSLESDPGRMLGMLLRGPVEGKVKEFLTKGAAEGLKEFCES